MGEGAGLAGGDDVFFDGGDGHEAHDGVGEEDFFGGEEVVDGQGAFVGQDAGGSGEFEGELAGDAGQAETSAEC